MKFSCERCGKKYATADKPHPGRVYKLKCKACGHLIVVKGSAASSTAAPTSSSPAPAVTPAVAPAVTPAVAPAVTPAAALEGAPVASAAPEAPPELELDIGAPEPAALEGPPTLRVNGTSSSETPLPRNDEPTTELSDANLGTTPTPAPVPALDREPTEAPTPAPAEDAGPPAEAGYVDIFADSPQSRGTQPEPAAEPAPPAVQDDPFLSVARASLPESFAGSSADPFAPIRAELEAAASAEVPKPSSAPLSTPKVPDIPRPPAQKKGAPLLLIGVGVAALLGILAFTLLRGNKVEPPRRPPAPIAVAPVQPPAPPPSAPVPAPAPDVTPPPPPEPEQEAKAEPPARHEPARAPERRRKAERTEKAKAEPKPDRVAQAEPPPRRGEVTMPEASAGLSEEQLNKVLASTRKAFDGCIANAAKSADVKLDGRKVALRLNIQENGTVTYPTFDDVTLNTTELGACLKSAARLMVFPKFRGDPIRIEVPLTLAK